MQSRSRRSGRLDITTEHQFDNVVYLGHCQSTVDIGLKGALDAVADLWNALPVGTRAVKASTGPIRPGPETARRLQHALPRVSVSISTSGIAMWEPGSSDKKDDGGNYVTTFDIKNISYCCADRYHPTTFAWISNSPAVDAPGNGVSRRRWTSECYAVVCNDVEEARRMVTQLVQAFEAAYRDYKYEKQRLQQQQQQQPNERPIE